MTGRIEVDKKTVDIEVYQRLKILFKSIENHDLQPGDQTSCIRLHDGKMIQEDCVWGIQPIWAHHPIYNAHAETITEKKTFASAYALNRCLVPCTAWFEWSGVAGRKTKHRFSHRDNSLLYLAGILYPEKDKKYQLVILTCEADINCGIYHHRMPLIIKEEKLNDWLQLPQTQQDLLSFHDLHPIEIHPPIR
jgi:putative SOS response-associated peptidase YedK